MFCLASCTQRNGMADSILDPQGPAQQVHNPEAKNCTQKCFADRLTKPGNDELQNTVTNLLLFAAPLACSTALFQG